MKCEETITKNQHFHNGMLSFWSNCTILWEKIIKHIFSWDLNFETNLEMWHVKCVPGKHTKSVFRSNMGGDN